MGTTKVIEAAAFGDAVAALGRQAHRLTRYLLALVLVASAPAHALSIAVFGDNSTDNLINTTFGAGSATLVTDAQIATPGFLSSFNAFYYTRNSSSFGTSLSAAAAANVFSYVGPTGRVVLLNGDFADDIGSAFTNTLTTNAVSFAAASGHGYIGEFTGSVAAFTANGNGFTPLSLLVGTAGALGGGAGGSTGSVNLAAAGVGHPVTAGLTFPTNPAEVEFGSAITGFDPSLVLATFDNSNPTILARSPVIATVAEPGTLLLVALGLFGTLAFARRSTQSGHGSPT